MIQRIKCLLVGMTDTKRPDAIAGNNPNKEIWRKSGNDSIDPDNCYQPSISVTPEQAIMICVGGNCRTLPIEVWHKLSKKPPMTEEEANKRAENIANLDEVKTKALFNYSPLIIASYMQAWRDMT